MSLPAIGLVQLASAPSDNVGGVDAESAAFLARRGDEVLLAGIRGIGTQSGASMAGGTAQTLSDGALGVVETELIEQFPVPVAEATSGGDEVLP